MLLMRSLLFNILLVLSVLVMGIPGLITLVLPRRAACWLREVWIALVLVLLRWTVGLTHRVEGARNIPAHGRFMVASKHQSAWETLALHTIFRDPAIVLKRELLMLPIIGWYFGKIGMVPINRGGRAGALREMIAAARKWTDAHRPTLIFPQGTRVAPGTPATAAPYHSGTFALYRALGVPVVPVALNSGQFWPRQAFRKYPGVITVRILPAIPPGLDRKVFMQRLRDVIESANRELEEAHRPIA